MNVLNKFRISLSTYSETPTLRGQIHISSECSSRAWKYPYVFPSANKGRLGDFSKILFRNLK